MKNHLKISKSFLKISIALGVLALQFNSASLEAINALEDANQKIEQRNREIHTLSPEQKMFIDELANAYKTTIYADVKKLTRKTADGKEILVMDPSDVLLDHQFDNDDNIQNNPDHIKLIVDPITGLPTEQFPFKAKLDYRVREYGNHYYVQPITHHAYDSASSHAQDSEDIVYIIEKNGSKFGKLVYVVLNNHGYAIFLSPDPELEAELNTRYQTILAARDVTARFPWDRDTLKFANTSLLDGPAGKDHQKSGKSVFDMSSGEPRGVSVFCSAGGHSLYKCNPEIFNSAGPIYKCDEPGKEDLIHCYPVPANQEIHYSLRNWDDFLYKLIPENLGTPLSDEQLKTIAEKTKLIFSGQMGENAPVEQEDGFIKIRPELPADWAKGAQEKKSEANLPHNQGYRLNFGSAYPDLQDQQMRPNAKISHKPIYNPDVIYTRLK